MRECPDCYCGYPTPMSSNKCSTCKGRGMMEKLREYFDLIAQTRLLTLKVDEIADALNAKEPEKKEETLEEAIFASITQNGGSKAIADGVRTWMRRKIDLISLAHNEEFALRNEFVKALCL